MKKFEYIRLAVDVGDLDELNRLASVGFRVMAVIDETETVYDPSFDKTQPGIISSYEHTVHYALLEREIE